MPVRSFRFDPNKRGFVRIAERIHGLPMGPGVKGKALPFGLLPPRLLQQNADLLVGDRGKIRIPQTDAEKRFRRRRTDDFVRFLPQSGNGTERRHRHRHHQPGGFLPAYGGHRTSHRRLSRQTVIDQNHTPPL
jgi:hypothetical protein